MPVAGGVFFLGGGAMLVDSILAGLVVSNGVWISQSEDVCLRGVNLDTAQFAWISANPGDMSTIYVLEF